ncbi:MAG: M23 family metallopeptidase [Oscillospiraceae bacterium]|nr:M23 family metallopeptidase [Oscillospiraceae bacterium]
MRLFTCLLACVIFFTTAGVNVMADDTENKPGADYIKWVDFDIPAGALGKAMDIDIKTYDSGSHISWIETLAVLGTKYGGEWKKYKASDMDKISQRLGENETPEQILEGYENYSYFYGAYSAVLSGFLGEYEKEAPDKENPGGKILKSGYGLKAYSPIAEGFHFSHYRDFGASRGYGYRRSHLGNDLCGSVGTPITAVEAGTVEEMGWNKYGGWRIGIRSFDQKRYYYYAHLRKGHPYAQNIKIGDEIQAGTVIGYMGMTGYSEKEDVNNMKIPHLHFGLQLIFDESQKDGDNQIWVDVYQLVELLQRNRATVERTEPSKEYVRKYNLYDERFPNPQRAPRKDTAPLYPAG